MADNKRSRKPKDKRRFSSVRKWFQVKAKQETVKDILENQEKFSMTLTTITRNFSDLLEGVSENHKVLDVQHSKISECISDLQDKKEIVKELKEQLNGRQKEERRLNKEIRSITSSHHELELKACRLELQNKHLVTENEALYKQLQDERDSVKEISKKFEESVRSKELLNEKVYDLQRRISALDFELKNAEKERDKMTEMKEEGDCMIYQMKEDRLSLLDYLRRKSLITEQRLRSSWAQINEARKQREEATETQQNKALQFRDSMEKDQVTTRLLELDLKLYRRNRLIELLTERLRLYEPCFDIRQDQTLSVYFDDNATLYDCQIQGDNEVMSETSSATSV